MLTQLRMLVTAQCRGGGRGSRPSLGPEVGPGEEGGCRSGGWERLGSGKPDPAAAREDASRGRSKTTDSAIGSDVSAPLAWAPALDSAPVPLRAALLSSGSGSPWARLGLQRRPPRRARGKRQRTMARAQALVLALTFQLCTPETETPAGKRVSVGPILPCGVPGPVA